MTEEQIKWLENYKKPAHTKLKQWHNKRIHIIWNNYHKIYQMYLRNKFPYLNYFLEWNNWTIKSRDLDESKIFNYNDLYTIQKANTF